MCLGLEPGAAGWKLQMNTLSYGGTPFSVDFIFHIQGQHEGNTLIVEVKGKLDKSGIKKDFETLITFVSKYKYEAGVFLLYNHTIKELIKILNQEFPDFEKVDCADRIFIIVLPTAGQVKQAQKLSSLK